MPGVKKIQTSVVVLFICATMCLTMSCRLYQTVNVTLHGRLDGKCLEQTIGDRTTELFCFEIYDPQVINGIAYSENAIYLAVNRGPDVTIEKRSLSGEMQASLTVASEAGQLGGLMDLAIDQTGIWAANGWKLIHYELTGAKDREILRPDGYESIYGVAIDQTNGNIFALVTDETGLERNCPAIATYNQSLELISLFCVPGISRLSPAFGLGYDELTNSFFVSCSLQSPDPDVMLNFSTSGEQISVTPIDHQSGSVENYFIQQEIPILGHVQFTVQAVISQGRPAQLEIFRDTINGAEMVESLPILIQDEQQFGFDLPPGNYWATITGIGVSSYDEFTIQAMRPNQVNIQLTELPVVGWYSNVSLNTPAGFKTPGMNMTIMDFWFGHDQEEILRPEHFTFTVDKSSGVNIDNCYLSYQVNGQFINLGTAQPQNNQIYFGIDNPSTLADISVVLPHTMTTYRLSCDVLATANETLRTDLTDFRGQPESTPQLIWKLPLYGGMLIF